ncbi:glutathione S-transferase family protein [Aquabacterium sp. A7-Y]|uniref:glutathione S-transferase family protein n=1 Tax=Aquabacterium sp. A7-Y TaxID=1349605 RepID=UPI00223C9B17|nr:glutathione S-transferase family protein [Aquabacterium sp. A7-Y]MCW7540634.1 glutathione S-transferase family protein [Aquabacterium sp. A7-Y]
MQDLILHHYAISPFSEKIRLILAHKRLAWQSVIVPSIMPKPDVAALTGGYRRTPFLQVGADIYCDTALMADVLEARQPSPSLFPADAAGRSTEGQARAQADWADRTLFWTAMAYSFQPAGIAALFEGAPPALVQAFAEDRAKMRPGAQRLPPAAAAVQLRNALGWLDDQLRGRDFLLGSEPGLADFAAYHPLWFVKRLKPIAGIFDAAPQVRRWLERIAAIGLDAEAPVQRSAAEAIEIAASAQAQPVPEAPLVDAPKLRLGERVCVTPTDYAFDPVEGELLRADERCVSLRRTDPRAGTVHVHFPRIGYELKPAQAQ